MYARIGVGFVIMAATGLMLSVACSKSETTSGNTTTVTTTTHSTTTSHQGGSGGHAGGAGGGANCQTACEELFTCATTGTPVRCPGLSGTTLNNWLNGSSGGAGGAVPGCLANCAANPTLAAVVDPNDCDGTVTTLKSFSQAFKAACKGAGGAGGAGGGGGG